MATTSLADKLKIWLFPSLMGTLGMLIWSDLQTIKTNIAIALTQTVTDKTNIENLNNRVNKLENAVFKIQPTNDSISKNTGSNPPIPSPNTTKIIATKPDEKEVVAKTIQKTTL